MWSLFVLSLRPVPFGDGISNNVFGLELCTTECMTACMRVRLQNLGGSFCDAESPFALWGCRSCGALVCHSDCWKELQYVFEVFNTCVHFYWNGLLTLLNVALPLTHSDPHPRGHEHIRFVFRTSLRYAHIRFDEYLRRKEEFLSLSTKWPGLSERCGCVKYSDPEEFLAIFKY